MALNKVTYTNHQTVITAENLNDIQDEIIANGNAISAIAPEKYGFAYGTCSTAESTTAKTATITGYKLVKNGYVAIRFTNAVPSGSSLNINSLGAKAIYYNNSAITANVIRAGNTALFVYDGSYYRLLSIDNNIGNATNRWHYVGKLIQGANTTVEGYGHADIVREQGNLLRIDFSARITTAGTESTGVTTYGIDSALLSSTIGATPVFLQGGNWIAINPSGNIIYSDMGYGTIMNVANSGKYAQPARKYAVSGSDAGSWLSSHWSVGTIIQGTCYATL